ncbi:hypothetical protein PS623_04215 [Pseudomonas fluorescens]|nr:hypothetical protein PS623_04215 [Pseudomonas fluorescens]
MSRSSRRCACWRRRSPGCRRRRARPSTRRRSWLRRFCIRSNSRRCRPSRRSCKPLLSGASSSAAADGVGARTSATKSLIETSVSWPTALTMGVTQAAIARATASSLKHQRSSSEPPPRARIRASKPRLSARRRACTIWLIASRPCTAVGIRFSSTCGARRPNTLMMSRITAPVGEVMIPMRCGCAGSGCLRSVLNRPSALSFSFSASKARRRAPSPAGSTVSRIS